MTTTDKLPPLAERLLDQRHYCDSFAEKVAYRHSADLAAPYDAEMARLRAENERLREIVHHAAEAARERRYQRLIENHDAPTNMMRSRDAEAKEIGMAMALAVAYEEPEV